MSDYPSNSAFNQDLNKLNNNAVAGNVSSPPASDLGAMTGGAKKTVEICGRKRVVSQEGKFKFVTIDGKKVNMTKAKEMDQKYKQQKKAKESAKKSDKKPKGKK